MGIGSSLGSVAGGIFGAKGSKKAFEAMQAYEMMARQEREKAVNDISGYFSPYRSIAEDAYQNSADVLGGNMTAFNSSPYGNFYNQYALDNTINNLQGTAAARGSLLSGNTLKELQTNIQSLLSSDYLNRLNNYLSSNMTVAQPGVNFTSQLGNLRQWQADANANSWSNVGSANSAQQLSKYNNLGKAWAGGIDLAGSLLGSAGGYFSGLGDPGSYSSSLGSSLTSFANFLK